MQRNHDIAPDLAHMIAEQPDAVLVRLLFTVAGLRLQVKALERHLEELEGRLKAMERAHESPPHSAE
jgi:uncharacterized coiled-coil protein SlyX